MWNSALENILDSSIQAGGFQAKTTSTDASVKRWESQVPEFRKFSYVAYTSNSKITLTGQVTQSDAQVPNAVVT